MRRILASLIGAAALMGMSASHAATYPERPVNIVVPYSAGGPVDIFSRALGQALSSRWGKPVIVVNRPGANEIIGADHVAKSAPDGYTLFAGTEAALTMGPHLYTKLPYDVQRDFVPVSHTISLPLVFFVSNKVQANTMKEFIELAKRSTDRPLSYGSTGAGGIAHLPMVTLEQQENISMMHVPYRGASNLIPDVISGEIDSAVLAVSVIEQHIKNGSVKALAVSSPQRSAALPDVPTFAEAGVTDINAVFNIGLLAPKGTPEDIVEQIARDVRSVIDDPGFRKTNIEDFSYVAVGSSPSEFNEFLIKDSQMQAKRIRDAGVTLN